MIAYTVSLGSDMLQMTKMCFWHLFLRHSGLIYFQLATIEPVRYLKSSGKTKVTKVRFFRKNLIFRGWISLEKCPFLLQISFLCQFSHLFGCLLQAGLIDHCQNWYIYNWHVLKCNWGSFCLSPIWLQIKETETQKMEEGEGEVRNYYMWTYYIRKLFLIFCSWLYVLTIFT